MGRTYLLGWRGTVLTAQSLNPDEREKVIAIHNLLLDPCRRAVCAARKAKNSQYKMSVRPMQERERE